MSEPSRNFVPDQFSGQGPGEKRPFELDPFVRDAEFLGSEFVSDLEEQREIQTAKILESGENVQEIFSDAMQKMKDQAEEIQKEAQEKGYEEGYEQGYEDGLKEAQEKFASSLEALQSLIEELTQAREKMYPRLEREVVEMVASLAKKVVRAKVEHKADGIREIVRMAVESVLDREALVIKIHPDDHRELENYGQELMELFHDIKNVRFEAHSSVTPGHCVVESNFGTVEAGLDHLDEQIEKILHLAPPAPPAPVEEELDRPDQEDPEEDDGLIEIAKDDEDSYRTPEEPDETEEPDDPYTPV